ncbi:MAG: Ig-like domain-containing protein, partial [Rubripirellula sp.]
MSRRKSNPKRRRSIGRFSPAMEQLEARRLLVGELLELQLSATRDGADLLDANRQLSLEVGERFDLEVRYADLRTGEQADGAFTLLTDIASDSPGAIVPVLRETQRLAFDQTIQTIAVDSVTFELEGSSQTEVVSFTTFESDPTAATIQALIAFGYQQSDFEVIRADSATQIILQVHYSGEQFGNIDLPNLSASVQETNPAENVATETIEIAPFNGDGSPNSNAVPFNIDTFNSSLGQIVYGNANGGTFDPNSGFVGVGGTGPIVTGGIPDLGTFVEPFFAYSLEVEVAAVTTNAGFSVAPGQSTESVLLYGQDNPLTPDLILLGAESQFVANFAAAPPAFTTNPTNPFDVNDSGTISLADGLQVANNLLAGVNSEPSGVSLDVNGDGRFSPNDLIAVLNEIERLDSGQGPAAVSGEVLELELDLLSVGGDSLLDASRIANVQAGDSIVVQLSYRDLRAAEDRLGALSVFADVLVSDASALRLPLANADFVDQITPATNYSLLGSPAFSTTLADTFDELGVLGPLAPIDDATGSVPVLSFTLVAESAASGLSFALDFPDEVDNEIQLYGAAAPLAPVNVLLGSSHAFTLNILDAASAPVANDDTSATQEDTVVTIDVLTNDVIPVGVDATLTVSGPSTAGGLLTVDGGQITYTPPVDFSGVDSFTYQVATANGNASAEVVVTVESVNDLPVVNDDPVTAQEDSILTLAFSDLLANDSDVDSVLSVTSVGEASNGSVTVSGETVTYAPAADFSGTDSFTYTVDDGSGGVVMGAVNVTVIEVNDAPLAIDDVAATNEDQVLTISAASLLVNDFDPDGAADTLTISSVSGGTGQVSLSGDTITYTPQADFVGSDTFTYEISDLAGATAF